MDKYLLRNTRGYDINLGDLRYKIPAGQVRNLLSKTARIDIRLLEKSIVSGSIAARLETGALVEVVQCPDLSPPKRVDVAKGAISFPRKNKSSIILDVSKLDEQLNNMIINEEEDLLQELQENDALSGEMGAAPLVTEEKDGTEKDSET